MTRALIVVDMQNLFVDAVGDDGPRVLAEVNTCISEAVDRGEPVFYTRDYAPVDDAAPTDPRMALHAGLDVRGRVVEKGPGCQGAFSAFVHAPIRRPQQGDGLGSLGELAGLLRLHGVTSVIVVGIATDICVASTARDAVRLGYDVRVPLTATSPLARDESVAIRELLDHGVVVDRRAPSRRHAEPTRR